MGGVIGQDDVFLSRVLVSSTAIMNLIYAVTEERNDAGGEAATGMRVPTVGT